MSRSYLHFCGQWLTIQCRQIACSQIDVFFLTRLGYQIQQHILYARLDILDFTLSPDASRIEDGNALGQYRLPIYKITARNGILIFPLVD